MKSATKAISSSTSTTTTGVFVTRGSKAGGSRASMRPAASGFSGFSTDAKKASWDELARERESDGETKNYDIPPELIALARATRKGRGQVGTLTPLAPKPAHEVVVVVPAPSPVAHVEAPTPGPSPTLELSSVAPHAAERESMRAASVPPPLPVMTSDEALPAEAEPIEAAPIEAEPHDSFHPESERSQCRRSSRRGRRSSRVQLPHAVIEAAQAEAGTAVAPSRLRRHGSFLIGAAIVGVYVVLGYYANAVLAGLP